MPRFNQYPGRTSLAASEKGVTAAHRCPLRRRKKGGLKGGLNFYQSRKVNKNNMLADILVPRRRLELPRPYGHQHLKLARLPFRHLGRWRRLITGAGV